MEGWTRVYSGPGPAARSLAEVLDRDGMRVFERLEERSHFADGGTSVPQTEVWVPHEDGDRAVRMISHWSTHNVERVGGLTARLLRLLAISAVLPVGWLGAALLAPHRVPLPTFEALGLAWVVLLVFLAQLEHRRHRRERIDLATLPPSS